MFRGLLNINALLHFLSLYKSVGCKQLKIYYFIERVITVKVKFYFYFEEQLVEGNKIRNLILPFLMLSFQQMEFADKSVVARGLVSSTPKIKDIVKEHSLYFDRDSEVTNFEGETLAYITPVIFVQQLKI